MTMEFFDYESAAREAGIPPDKLALICCMMRSEYPGDEMLYELHVLRACMAVRTGHADLEEIVSDVHTPHAA
jgi:hypothetical protein